MLRDRTSTPQSVRDELSSGPSTKDKLTGLRSPPLARSYTFRLIEGIGREKGGGAPEGDCAAPGGLPRTEGEGHARRIPKAVLHAGRTPGIHHLHHLVPHLKRFDENLAFHAYIQSSFERRPYEVIDGAPRGRGATAGRVFMDKAVGEAKVRRSVSPAITLNRASRIPARR